MQDPYEKDKKTSSCTIFTSKGIPSRAARALIVCLMNEDYRFRGTYNTIVNSEWMKSYNKWFMADQHFTYEVIRAN